MSPQAANSGEPYESVFDAYRRTIIDIDDGARRRHRIGPHDSAPESLAGSGVFHVITAWNPMGRKRSRAENDAAQLALRSEIEARCTRVAAARGHDPDGRWEAEESVAIWGLSRVEAIELGQRLEQNAIFEVSADGALVVDCRQGRALDER